MKEREHLDFSANSFALQPEPCIEITPELQVCADMQPHMPKKECNQKKDLMATFGYPIGMSKRLSYARFDIRDEVCRRVSGFKHGQVVRDNSDGDREFIVVGVKPDFKTGKELIWVQARDC